MFMLQDMTYQKIADKLGVKHETVKTFLDRARQKIRNLSPDLTLGERVQIKNTVLDALKFGFRTFFLWDGSRGINANAGDIEKSIELMEEYGAKKVILSNFYF